MEERKFADILTLIARRGQVVYCDSVTWRDIETAKLVGEDTIIRIYSMTKPITSVAVMMIYEDVHFRPVAPPYEYLPEVRVASCGARWGRGIKAGHFNTAYDDPRFVDSYRGDPFNPNLAGMYIPVP